MTSTTTGRRATATFWISRRQVLITEAVDHPVVVLGASAFFLASICDLFNHPTLIPCVGTPLVIAACISWPLRKLKAAGLLHGYQVTLTADDDGLAYAIPGKSIALPWNVWSRATKRCGIWFICLAAQPSRKISFPASALDAEEAAVFTDFFVRRGLLRQGRL